MNSSKLVIKILKALWSQKIISVFCILILLLSAPNVYSTLTVIPRNYYRYWFSVFSVCTPLFSFIFVSVLTYLFLHYSKWGYMMLIPLIFTALITIPGCNTALYRSRQASCMMIQRQLWIACTQYADKHNGNYPSSLEVLFKENGRTLKDLRCPLNRWHNPDDVDYAYFGSGVRKDKEDPNAVLIQDRSTTNHAWTSLNNASVMQTLFSGEIIIMRNGIKSEW